MKDTTVLDKLYLEWSQFTSARTERELNAESGLRRIAIILGYYTVGEEDVADAKNIAEKALTKYTEI